MSTDGWLDQISKSPIMIGIAVLLINMGGRFIANDMTRYDEKLLNNAFMKKLTIFSIAFLSTRDIRYSVIIVFLYSVLFHPCGLAYKIMKKTERVINPFAMMSDLTSVNSTVENDVSQSIRIEKVRLY
jgi:hypothetical protein